MTPTRADELARTRQRLALLFSLSELKALRKLNEQTARAVGRRIIANTMVARKLEGER